MALDAPVKDIQELLVIDSAADHMLVADASDSDQFKKVKPNNLLTDSETVTVASGAATLTSTALFVDVTVTGEGGLADTLDTLTRATGAPTRQVVLLRSAGSYDITLSHSTSANRFKIPGGATLAIAGTDGVALAVFNGTGWDHVAISDNDGA